MRCDFAGVANINMFFGCSRAKKEYNCAQRKDERAKVTNEQAFLGYQLLIKTAVLEDSQRIWSTAPCGRLYDYSF